MFNEMVKKGTGWREFSETKSLLPFSLTYKKGYLKNFPAVVNMDNDGLESKADLTITFISTVHSSWYIC